LTSAPADFDRLARIYQPLELLAFGRDLERARFCFLDRLRDCRSILVLGEGDGRCLARLAQMAPAAEVHCVDASAAMLARAAARRPRGADDSLVRFDLSDVLTTEFTPYRYDAIVTFFFLDCFTPEQVAAIVGRVRPALRHGALWLFADFAVPSGRLARWRARSWLTVLYAFFRVVTGLTARVLPPSDDILREHGFQMIAERWFRRGFVRTAIFRWP
jgi:cyclopropane fatty-acyl-phospholipid synthase-like methyltransferase